MRIYVQYAEYIVACSLPTTVGKKCIKKCTYPLLYSSHSAASGAALYFCSTSLPTYYGPRSWTGGVSSVYSVTAFSRKLHTETFFLHTNAVELYSIGVYNDEKRFFVCKNRFSMDCFRRRQRFFVCKNRFCMDRFRWRP